MKTIPPSTNDALRRDLQAGAIYRLPADTVSLALAEKATALFTREFPGIDLRKIHETFSFAELAPRLAPLRRLLADDPSWHAALLQLIAARGFTPENNAFDPLRLRCVLHGGHENARSERAYALHRDTWYGNPQGQINWWMPLYDVTEEETFAFYGEYFDAPVENCSSLFNYDDMLAQTGWQGTKGGTYPWYPAAPENLVARRKGFSASAGEIILFSAAQLHGTCKAATGFTRWSLDFRTVHLGDLDSGTGAPNVDNGSLPLAAAKYLRTPAGAPP
jgi:hypothetical protein